MSNSTATSEKRMQFFSAADLGSLPDDAEGPEFSDIEVTYQSDAEKSICTSTSKLMQPHIKSSSFDFADCGMHFGVFEFGPGLIVPLHSHPDNCIYYVERGSVIMGNRELGPGEGFLTRENLPYAFTVGAKGLRLIEMTTGPRKAVTFHEKNLQRWKARTEVVIANLENAQSAVSELV